MENLHIILMLFLVSRVFLINSKIFTVLKIHNDSTITVKNSTSAYAFRIILACVDVPDLKQEIWGQMSLNRLKNLVPIGSEITLNLSEDAYQRKTAELFTANGTNIAEKLLSEGLIVLQPNQNGCNEYYQAEQNNAIVNKIGVWSDDDFILPFVFRQDKVLDH